MAETEDDTGYSPNTSGVRHQQGFRSVKYQRHSFRSTSYSGQPGNQFIKEEDDEFEEDVEGLQEEDDGDYQNNLLLQKGIGCSLDEDEDGDTDIENEDGDSKQESDRIKAEDVDIDRRERRLKTSCLSYEIVPRVPVPSVTTTSAPKSSFGGRNSLTEWTEQGSFALLDAWGDRFLQNGSKSLRSEEWQEVAEKVSEVSNLERTDTQCRNRIDTLKKKYKKEKLKLAEMTGETSHWVYFKKMDKLLSAFSQQASLSCGLDPGEYIRMTPKGPLNSANGLDAMRDTPENSGSTGFQEDSEELPPKKRRYGRDEYEGSAFRLIANSIQKFSEIYEKIENIKRQQLKELEKMRMDFFRKLEVQRRQIFSRAQAEIAKIRLELDVENDDSAETANG